MTQQSNQSTAAGCLKDKLVDTEKKAKEAEFHKQTAATLQDLIDKSEKETDTYRDALPGLIATWQEQDGRLRTMKKHLESCYPEWECYLRQSVCKDVICHIWQLRQTYESKLGAPELRLGYANSDKDKATLHLEAWKTMTSWISTRLSDNKTLFDRICALDNCQSPLLQLYLFFFILWPQHRQLCKSPRNLPENEAYPEYGYCSDMCCAPEKACTCLVGYPWIIRPEDYDCQLTRVWQAWSNAGIRAANAQSAYDQIAKDKEEYEKQSTPEAMELAALGALKIFDSIECKPCPEEEPCHPQSEECGDPCKVDPCLLDENGDEDDNCDEETQDPCDEDAPGICEELECDDPEPDPCDESESDPCDEPETDPCDDPEPDPCDEPEEPAGTDSNCTPNNEQKPASPPRGKSTS